MRRHFLSRGASCISTDGLAKELSLRMASRSSSRGSLCHYGGSFSRTSDSLSCCAALIAVPSVRELRRCCPRQKFALDSKLVDSLAREFAAGGFYLFAARLRALALLSFGNALAAAVGRCRPDTLLHVPITGSCVNGIANRSETARR